MSQIEPDEKIILIDFDDYLQKRLRNPELKKANKKVSPSHNKQTNNKGRVTNFENFMNEKMSNPEFAEAVNQKQAELDVYLKEERRKLDAGPGEKPTELSLDEWENRILADIPDSELNEFEQALKGCDFKNIKEWRDHSNAIAREYLMQKYGIDVTTLRKSQQTP